MCQTGCQYETSWEGNCTLKGPCPYEMTEAEIEDAKTDEDAEVDYRYENLEALKRREEP